MASSLAVFARAQYGRRTVRYSLVSVVAVAVTQVVLVVCQAGLGWQPVPANLAAVSIGSIPSYTLNRYWVWGKRGRNHLWREVVPFWAMALTGLALSTAVVAVATRWSDAAWVTSVANLFAFGVLWVAKFMVLDSLLFRLADHELGPESDAADRPPLELAEV
jgi:putative flippase GtrA